ncbi:CHASE2 domain-containing protein [Maribacter sp.]
MSFFTPFNNAFKDFSYLDLYYAEKLDRNIGDINKDIVLVNVERLGRAEIAAMMTKLERQKPKVIGLDIIFKEERDPIEDRALAQSHRMENLVTTYSLLNSGVDSSAARISRPDQISGYSNFSFDPTSSVVRNFQGYRKDGDSVQVAFGVAVAKFVMGEKWDGSLERYLDEERPINYKGNRDNFLILEPDDVLGRDTIPVVMNKIVLMGYLGHQENHRFDIEDKHFTPMNEKFVGKSAPDTFGVVIHANIINMIVSDDFISVVPNWILVLLTILFTFLALTYFIWLAKRQLASYILRLNIVRLVFIAVFVWIALLLFRNGILFKTAGIIAVAAFSIGLIGYYKKLAHFLYKKYKWNGYFYQD